MTNMRRADLIAAAITAPLIGAYFVLPVALWFAITIAIGIGIAIKTGL